MSPFLWAEILNFRLNEPNTVTPTQPNILLQLFLEQASSVQVVSLRNDDGMDTDNRPCVPSSIEIQSTTPTALRQP